MKKQKTNWVLTIVFNIGNLNRIFPAVYGCYHCLQETE